MTDLIACLSSGKGTWGHVSRLMQAEQWTKIFLVTDEFGRERFTSEIAFERVVIDSQQPLQQLAESIRKQLDGKFTDLEIAVNFISGSGKEHMALLSAMQQLGVGFRFDALDEEGKVIEM